MGQFENRARLIDLIYEATVEDALWASVINDLAELVGAQNAQISTFNSATGTFVENAPRMPPEAMREYSQRWVQRNPYIPIVNQYIRAGSVFHDHSVIQREVFRRTKIYNEFFTSHGLDQGIAAKLLADDAGVALIALWRDAESAAFDAADIDLLASVVPHLQRALRLTERLAGARISRDASAEMLDRLDQAVLLVDARCHVMFANSRGEAVLADGSGLHRGTGGVLLARRSTETLQLHTSVKKAAENGHVEEINRGGKVRVSCGHSAATQTIVVVPLRFETDWLRTRKPAAMLFVSGAVRKAGPTPPVLQQEYGLTRMEAAVALQVLEGRGLPAAATQLGIAPTTARTHLTAVFGKTGARTQVDLVRLLLQTVQ